MDTYMDTNDNRSLIFPSIPQLEYPQSVRAAV